MRRLRHHPLIALLCALFLLGAQQAAYAHFLSHLGIAAETVVQDGGDNEHGAATTLSHVCTTCAAFSALAGAAPMGDMPAIGLAAAAGAPTEAFSAPFVARAGPPAGARAPPSVL